MQPVSPLDELPGAELVLPGLRDVQEGRITIAACLVWIAFPRLERAGLIANRSPAPILDPELLLYRLLQQEGGNAYGRYNALLRRLVSFERALGDGRTKAES